MILMPSPITIAHEMEQRIRLRGGILKNRDLDPDYFEANLETIPGVNEVRINTRAASVVVTYDGDGLKPEMRLSTALLICRVRSSTGRVSQRHYCQYCRLSYAAGWPCLFFFYPRFSADRLQLFSLLLWLSTGCLPFGPGASRWRCLTHRQCCFVW